MCVLPVLHYFSAVVDHWYISRSLHVISFTLQLINFLWFVFIAIYRAQLCNGNTESRIRSSLSETINNYRSREHLLVSVVNNLNCQCCFAEWHFFCLHLALHVYLPSISCLFFHKGHKGRVSTFGNRTEEPKAKVNQFENLSAKSRVKRGQIAPYMPLVIERREKPLKHRYQTVITYICNYEEGLPQNDSFHQPHNVQVRP